MNSTSNHTDAPLVLVVDDDFSLRLLMQAALEREGFVVQSAADGPQALATFDRHQPDIVLLDVMMPVMDGFATCTALRHRLGGQYVPVLMITGLDDLDSINQAYEVGATDFLTKPIIPGLLGHRVRYLLRASQAMAQLRGKEAALQQARNELEQRVLERTTQLAATNSLLQHEIAERKQAEQLKDELVSTVSHELRTPLTSLRGFTELLLHRTFSVEKQHTFLTTIHKESIRLSNLINDFLDLQRIAAGRQTYQFTGTALEPLVTELLDGLAQTDLSHTWRLALPATLPPVRIDVDRIRQVLTNLLSNAQKFSPHGGEISLGARLTETQVVVWVADQGLGIQAEMIPQLFNRFFRVDNTETRHIRGTGLGLALCKDIIAAHGGNIWVESVWQQGSTFFFSLPPNLHCYE